MPDLREVFEMVKQQTEPDLDSWAEQERRMRREQRKQKVGAFALVAVFAVAAFVFVLSSSSDDGDGAPSIPAESVDPTPDSQGVAPVVGFAHYDLETGDVTGIGIRASSSAVDVSPDGTKITYVDTATGTGDIVHVANIDGSDEQSFQRTDLAGDAKAPRWSPDGTKIVFNAGGDIYVMNADGTNEVRLTPDEQGFYASWSHDGTRILFSSWRQNGWQLWAMNAEGSNQVNHWIVNLNR